MDIKDEKLGLIEWISGLKDKKTIGKLKKIQEEQCISEDWWDSLKDKELESIKRGLKDIKAGRVHSHETARKFYEKYL